MQNKQFGLSNSDVLEIIALLKQNPAVEKAVIFGSRAKGNYKNGSDVDIALFGASLHSDAITCVSCSLNEDTLMPYFFDILHYDSLTNQELQNHIDRVGKEFYRKSSVLNPIFS